jgi:hypothetical protein
MTVANATGWELLCPFGATVEWNGGPLTSDIAILPDPPLNDHAHFISSHFQGGVLTFHPGYLFRTDPGWAVLTSGSPNQPKHGISPLTGIVETDWLPFSFTMNWIFTAPGRVRFEKGEPFCFINLMEHKKLDGIKPQIRELHEDPKLRDEFHSWMESRNKFNSDLAKRDPATLKQGWQRHYFRGEAPPNGGTGASDHISKRRLKDPTQ